MKKNELALRIDSVLKTIESRQDIVNKPILQTLHKRYRGLLHALETDDNIRKYSICGGVRAYLDATSNYADPLLEELYKAEKVYEEILKQSK